MDPLRPVLVGYKIPVSHVGILRKFDKVVPFEIKHGNVFFLIRQGHLEIPSHSILRVS